jgi:hypothetical protein
MDTVELKLPKWKSHKIVQADKVVGVEKRPVGEQAIKDDTFLLWLLEGGGAAFISHELRRRGGKDPIGGYLVIYEDGYQSWSPAEAFEEGYTRLEDPQDV